MKKIAYVSGTRADFGLMSAVLEEIKKHPDLELQLYATGVHLSTEFGLTIKHIKKQFSKVKEIPAVFNNDSREGLADFISDFVPQLIKTLKKNRPDFILILGDRVEMLCLALAAVYLRIPTGHLHGGDRSSTVDEVARHAITKLASLHFAASEDSAKRIIMMGEDGWRVRVVGAPALDFILNQKLPTREALFRKIGVDLKEKVIALVQHPVSEETDLAFEQMKTTVDAVKEFNMHTVAIFPHPDPGGRRIIEVLEKERGNPLFHLIPSLEFKDYLALEKEAEVLVGNSSSAMIESSSFGLPVVNIGDRQRNRLRGENVVDVPYSKEAIVRAISKSLGGKYRESLKKIQNPWGEGKASKKIIDILLKTDLKDPKLLNKQISY